jgi:uncharacterized protein YdhG (YjbR/CyaY superfamily)
MDDAVRQYIDRIPAGRRQLFDRVHRLVVDSHPDVAIGLSYGMPTYRTGSRRLHVAAWKHGISFYGWGDGGGFLERHPGLHNGKGTIRVRPSDADAITDQDFLELVRAALDGDRHD